MQKRERRLTALLLGCLALVSAAVTAWVCLKEQPGNVAAFETRFLDVSGMGFEAGEGLALEALPDALTLRWEAGEGAERSAASAAVPLEPGTREATLTVYASGAHNALASERWGYQVWLEWTCLSQEDGHVIDTARIELPLESDKERARACAVSVRAEPEDPCRVQARVLVTPLDGETAAGHLTLADWEVSAR